MPGHRSRSDRGFTLPETLVATAILVSGLMAVAGLFSYSINTNVTTQQATQATLILYDKMERFRNLPLSNAELTAGGGLTPASPVSNYYDSVTVASNGAITIYPNSTAGHYLRLWQITAPSAQLRTVTCIVWIQRSGLTRRRMEMARAATTVTNKF